MRLACKHAGAMPHSYHVAIKLQNQLIMIDTNLASRKVHQDPSAMHMPEIPGCDVSVKDPMLGPQLVDGDSNVACHLDKEIGSFIRSVFASSCERMMKNTDLCHQRQTVILTKKAQERGDKDNMPYLILVVTSATCE